MAQLVKAEYEHALVDIGKRIYGGAFNLTLKRGNDEYVVHVRKIDPGEQSMFYRTRNGEDMWNEPLPKSVREAVHDWCDNDFETALIVHGKKMKAELDRHVRIAIERIEKAAADYSEKIEMLYAELDKATNGEGFDPYVDRDEYGRTV